MGDLIGFQGSLNKSAAFKWDEYDFAWKSERRYHDFLPGNADNNSCQYPDMYDEAGDFLGNITTDFHHCKISEFDQVGFFKMTLERWR
jgi:alpha-1,3-glucan synthase